MNLVLVTAICWLVADAYWALASRQVKRTIALGQKFSARRVYLVLLVFEGIK